MRLRAIGTICTAVVAAACGGDGGAGPSASACRVTLPELRLSREGPPQAREVADPEAGAAAGIGQISTVGEPVAVSARNFVTRASAFTVMGGITFSVVDAFEVDANRRPLSELFIFLTDTVGAGATTLVPVTLGQLHDPNFFPVGAFAVFGAGYDSVSADYSRWFLADSGCVDFKRATAGRVGHFSGSLRLSGKWYSPDGVALQEGFVTANISSPMLRYGPGPSAIRDTIEVHEGGERAALLQSHSADAWQVLAPSQSRLVVVASAITTDTTREIWLSMPGVVAAGDSVGIDSLTLAQARSGRAPSPFGMLRMLQPATTSSTQPVVKEIWRAGFSSGTATALGFIKLTNVVQNGPLGLCGWVTGRFSVRTIGTDLYTAPGAYLGTSSITGSFETSLTVLPPSDTLVERATVPLAARLVRRASPRRASNRSGCAF